VLAFVKQVYKGVIEEEKKLLLNKSDDLGGALKIPISVSKSPVTELFSEEERLRNSA